MFFVQNSIILVDIFKELSVGKYKRPTDKTLAITGCNRINKCHT